MQTQLDSFFRSETLCTIGEVTEKQSASGLHIGTALQRSLVCNMSRCGWAHRTTTVKCSKGHFRHATASEQLPLGPMLDALRAPPVPPGRDLQASEDLIMDLDEQPSKRPRDTPSSSTQQFDSANRDEFAQRARNVSVPLPRLLSNLCQLQRHPFSPCHMETLRLRRHSCRFLQRHHFNVFQEERQRP